MKGSQGHVSDVRRFIIDEVESHPRDITRVTSDRFGISRQAVNKHLQLLVSEGSLDYGGKTRARTYSLPVLRRWEREYPISPALTEDRPWVADILPLLDGVSEGARSIWHYGFAEMFNNALDHSAGEWVRVAVEITARGVQIVIADNGVGVFRKIREALDLADERQAPLELAKGKFTTDPLRHSGEGIFFTSRMFDRFVIHSGEVFFSHEYGEDREWIVEGSRRSTGTAVTLALASHVDRTTADVFDQFAGGEDYTFDRTVVPVALAQFGDAALISRSQGRRLLHRFERFDVVVLDFRGVREIGQAFADEVFRVFANSHPEVEVQWVNASDVVLRMISRARGHR